MSVSCECCELSGRDLCDELITRPEESHLAWCVVVCKLKTSWMRRLWPPGGCCAKKKKLVLKAIIRTVSWYFTLPYCSIRKCTTIIFIRPSQNIYHLHVIAPTEEGNFVCWEVEWKER